jgi:hypothetical protein
MLTKCASTGERVISLEIFSLVEKHQTQYICTLTPVTPFFSDLHFHFLKHIFARITLSWSKFLPQVINSFYS